MAFYKGDEFGTAGKVLFVLCLLAGIVAIGLFTYLSSEEPTVPRGAAGPLQQAAPGSTPPPVAAPPGR